MLTYRIAGRHRVHLVIAVHRLLHALLQDAVFIPGKQRIPAAAPDHLDHMPVRTAEGALQLLNDLAVAPHRAVEPLQVAVDHQHQVVEALAAGNVDGAEHLRLVRFAVANERPDLAAVVRLQAAAFQVFGEPGLVNGAWGRKPHARRWHLPELREPSRVRIARQAAAFAELATEVGELGCRQPPLEERPGIDPGRRVRLEVHLIAPVLSARRPEHVIEPHLHHGGGREVSGDVTADTRAGVVSLQHHGHRIPADDVADPGFQLDVARVPRLLPHVDRVLVGGVQRGVRQHQPPMREVRLQLLDQVLCTFGTALLEHVVHRLEPLGQLLLPRALLIPGTLLIPGAFLIPGHVL